MATQKTDRIPTPVYAAAGAGDLAYQKLRQLPERVAELRGRVGEQLPDRVAGLRGRMSELRPAVTEESLRSDLDRLRAAARRNAATVVSGAHAAQQRAAVVYTDLVARGEHVVRAAKAQRETAAAPTPSVAATEVVAVEAEPVAAAITAPVEPVTEPVTPGSAVEETLVLPAPGVGVLKKANVAVPLGERPCEIPMLCGP